MSVPLNTFEPGYEEKSIRDRLTGRDTIYVARPIGIETAIRMAADRKVVCQWGQDELRGVLLVRKAPSINLRPVPSGGGAVA